MSTTRVSRQLLIFAAAGCLGFGVDAGCLYLLMMGGLSFYSARVLSFLCAVYVTWRINRKLTFKPASGHTEPRSAWLQWWRYLLAMSAGGMVNYAVGALIYLFAPDLPMLGTTAVAGGSMCGLVVNFASAKWWVFRTRVA